MAEEWDCDWGNYVKYHTGKIPRFLSTSLGWNDVVNFIKAYLFIGKTFLMHLCYMWELLFVLTVQFYVSFLSEFFEQTMKRREDDPGFENDLHEVKTFK